MRMRVHALLTRPPAITRVAERLSVKTRSVALSTKGLWICGGATVRGPNSPPPPTAAAALQQLAVVWGPAYLPMTRSPPPPPPPLGCPSKTSPSPTGPLKRGALGRGGRGGGGVVNSGGGSIVDRAGMAGVVSRWEALPLGEGRCPGSHLAAGATAHRIIIETMESERDST